MDSLLYYVAAHVVAHFRMGPAADRGKTAVRSDIDFVGSGERLLRFQPPQDIAAAEKSLSVGRATVFRWRRQGLLRLAGGKENSVFVRFSALIFSRCFFFRLALFFRFFRLGKPGIVP